ncbi:hypothetical protein BH160DRAFT_5799 [Burkholderia sp. H160]|nr:hypothetical protein BH160DRAFT_5799 [Burkholderia sp. H160]
MEMRRTEEMSGVPAGDSEAHARTLVGLLLADAVTDVEVVRRELGLSEQMVERLQRAVDKLGCAQTILEAMGGSRLANSGGEYWGQVADAVRWLAGNWPQEYPEGAVEWLLIHPASARRALVESATGCDH